MDIPGQQQSLFSFHFCSSRPRQAPSLVSRVLWQELWPPDSRSPRLASLKTGTSDEHAISILVNRRLDGVRLETAV